MPTYEYRCKNCGHEFDVVQSFSDDSLTECPSCHQETLKKVFGNVGITFKGSGFYKTDSRSAGSFGSTRDADASDTGSSSTSTSTSTSTKESSGSSDAGTSSSASNSGSSTPSSSSTPSAKPA